MRDQFSTGRMAFQCKIFRWFKIDCEYFSYEMQVEQSHQRKGLGAYMLNLLEQTASLWHMEYTILTVLKNNPEAMKFYERLGFAVDESSPEASEKAPYQILSKPTTDQPTAITHYPSVTDFS